jgi:hypothetical protein
MYGDLLNTPTTDLAVLGALELETICRSTDCHGVPPKTASKLINIAIITKRAEAANKLNFWIAAGTIITALFAGVALVRTEINTRRSRANESKIDQIVSRAD